MLGVERVGIHDPFLDLGGNSLLAMRLLAGVVETFGAELSVQTLLNTPTVASMAEAIVQRLVEQAEPATIAQLLEELGQVRRE